MAKTSINSKPDSIFYQAIEKFTNGNTTPIGHLPIYSDVKKTASRYVNSSKPTKSDAKTLIIDDTLNDNQILVFYKHSFVEKVINTVKEV